MKDRFRFRAWNTCTKIMKEVSQISFDDKQIAEYAPKDKISVHLNFQPHFILMQCTGLRARNGKLIYEGDIVKFSSIYGYGIFEIKWSDELGSFGYEDKETDFCELGRLYQEAAYVEILGNIYENPELLDVQDAKEEP